MLATFDFDSTLTLVEFDHDKGDFFTVMQEIIYKLKIKHIPKANDHVIIILKALAAQGIEIGIVSTRKETKENRDEIQTFIDINHLNIKFVLLTDGKPKASFLNAIQSSMHFDDMNREDEEDFNPHSDFEPIIFKGKWIQIF